MLRHKSIIVSISMLVFLVGFQTTSNAKSTALFSSDSTIVINPLPLPNPYPPKAPIQVPISANYQSSTSSVLLWFSYNLGEIEVEVLNSTTGGRFTSIVDTQFLYAIIPVNLGPGHYIITFTLPSGQQFQGDFFV